MAKSDLKYKSTSFLGFFRSFGKLILLAFILQACAGQRNLDSTDMSYLYDQKKVGLRPDFRVFHLNDSISRIYYRIENQNLLYRKDSESLSYKALFELQYKLTFGSRDEYLLDTARFQFEDAMFEPSGKVINGYFDLKTSEATEAQMNLQILLTDQNRDQSFLNYIIIHREGPMDYQNFLLTDTLDQVIFKNHLPTGIPFKIKYLDSTKSIFFLSHYQNEFPLAKPPYSGSTEETFSIDPKSTLKVNLNKTIRLNEKGIFHLRLDTSEWDGFTVHNYNNQYPYVATYVQMAEPLRYLTTKREYKEIIDNLNKPEELELLVKKFWRKRAGSIDRSKVIVDAFYSRVQYSNIFFHSYLEGWKSDRGIIYIIYGAPDKVQKNSDGEIWIYGDETSTLSYSFTFGKVNNPFSENDYSLIRSPEYRYGWGRAIEAWRNGQIYNSNDIKLEQEESDRIQYQQRSPYWY